MFVTPGYTTDLTLPVLATRPHSPGDTTANLTSPNVTPPSSTYVSLHVVLTRAFFVAGVGGPEVAGAHADIEVIGRDVCVVKARHHRCRAAPRSVREPAEDDQVVEAEKPGRVDAMTSRHVVRRVIAHRPETRIGGSPVGRLTTMPTGRGISLAVEVMSSRWH